MPTVLEDKLSSALDRLLARYPEAVRGIYLVGTAAHAPTPTSDLDLLLIFDDAFFTSHFDALRGELDDIAGELNNREPRHELAFWISKADHFETLLPDVSYLRANTPTERTRLDGWCGLGKHALMRYAATSGRRVHGDFEFRHTPAKAPATEAPELFLIATRALAKGVACLDAPDPTRRAIARNEAAKAGLRAIAALLLAQDGTVHLSYDSILEAGRDVLPDDLGEVAQALYAVKTTGSGTLDVGRLIDLFRHCERAIATTPYLATSGLSVGRAGESFAFDLEAIKAQSGSRKQDIGTYNRVPYPEQNHYLFLYFVRTASRMIELLDAAETADGPTLDFFLPELAAMAALTSLNPSGMKMMLGRSEREMYTISLGVPMAARLLRLLQRLDTYLATEGAQAGGTPWMPLDARRQRVKFLLFQLASIPQLNAPKGLGDFDQGGLVDHLEWQLQLMKGQFSLPAIEQFSKFALLLYQTGDLAGVRRIVEPLLPLADRLNDLADAMGKTRRAQAEALKPLLSNATQYYALTYHREGDVGTARDTYLRAMQLDPRNKSALADLTKLLLDHAPDDASAALLGDLVAKAGGGDDMRMEVAQQFQGYAISAKQAGHFETAMTWYTHAISLHPRWAKPWYNRGLLHEAQRDAAAAVADYRAAIERDPAYVHPRNQYADLLRETGNVDGAMAVLAEVFERGLENTHSHNSLGCCALEKRDLDGAVAAFQAAIDSDGDNLIALSNLASARAARGRASGNSLELMRAVALAAEATRRDPSDQFARALHARLSQEAAEILGAT